MSDIELEQELALLEKDEKTFIDWWSSEENALLDIERHYSEGREPHTWDSFCGRSPIADCFPENDSYLKIAELFIKKGIDINKADYCGYTSLMIACSPYSNNIEMAKFLLLHGADTNLQGYYYETALHIAMESGSLKIIELLISNGADLNIQKNEGQTPLHLAVKFNRKDVLEFLFSSKNDDF